MEEVKPIGQDVSGYQILTNAVLALLNQYPGLNGREILFEELGAETGIAFSADNGALVITEKRSITDHVTQTCQCPFFLIYRTTATTEFQKLKVQSFFDGIGKWICKESVAISGGTIRLKRYPELSDGRKITRITRSNSYGLEPSEDGVQDWLMPVTVQYTNEFDMW